MKHEINQDYLLLLIREFFKIHERETGIINVIKKRKGFKGIYVYFKGIESFALYFDHRVQCNVLIYDHRHLSKAKNCDIMTSFDVFIYTNSDHKFYDPHSLETKKYDSIEELLHLHMFDPLYMWLLDNITASSKGYLEKIYINNEYSYCRGKIY